MIDKMSSKLSPSKFLGKIISNIISNMNLDPRRIIKWYAFILMFTPFALLMFIQTRSVYMKVSPIMMVQKYPTVTIAVITCLIDFILGYYCFLHIDKIANSKKTFKVFITAQLICQTLFGNFMCIFLGILGLYSLKKIKISVEDETYQQVKLMSVLSLILFIICFLLILVINFK